MAMSREKAGREAVVNLRKRKSRLRKRAIWRREWVIEGRVGVLEEGVKGLRGRGREEPGGLRGVEKLDGSEGSDGFGFGFGLEE